MGLFGFGSKKPASPANGTTGPGGAYVNGNQTVNYTATVQVNSATTGGTTAFDGKYAAAVNDDGSTDFYPVKDGPNGTVKSAGPTSLVDSYKVTADGQIFAVINGSYERFPSEAGAFGDTLRDTSAQLQNTTVSSDENDDIDAAIAEQEAGVTAAETSPPPAAVGAPADVTDAGGEAAVRESNAVEQQITRIDGISNAEYRVTLRSQTFTSDRIIFKVMPTFDETRSATYDTINLTHMPTGIQVYKNSQPRAITMTAKLISRNTLEATENLRYLNLIRSWIMPYYGTGTANSDVTVRSDGISVEVGKLIGAPPDVLSLNALSYTAYKDMPCVLTSYAWTFADDVDYVRAEILDEGGSVRRFMPFPRILEVTLNLIESYSPDEISQFDIGAYRKGYLGKAFGQPTPTVLSTLTSGEEADFLGALTDDPIVDTASAEDVKAATEKKSLLDKVKDGIASAWGTVKEKCTTLKNKASTFLTGAKVKDENGLNLNVSGNILLSDGAAYDVTAGRDAKGNPMTRFQELEPAGQGYAFNGNVAQVTQAPANASFNLAIKLDATGEPIPLSPVTKADMIETHGIMNGGSSS